MNADTYTCLLSNIHTHIHTLHTCIRTYIQMYAHIHIYDTILYYIFYVYNFKHLCLGIHTYIHANAQTDRHTYKQNKSEITPANKKHIHTYIHYIHTYIHTYIHYMHDIHYRPYIHKHIQT